MPKNVYDQLSLRFCFTCPLPDCAGAESPRCPIQQHRRREAERAPEGYLTLNQLAARLGVARTTVSKWFKSGRISTEGIKRGRRSAKLVPVSRLGEFEKLCR